MRRHTGATEDAALGRAAQPDGLSRVSPSPPHKKLILALVDGLTPSTLEGAVGTKEAPALTLLAENARYTRAVSVFPSLTPVCVSSIVTGSYPDAHRIPHLVWYHREQRRLVEYGSSFGAIRRAGMRQAILDAILNMTGEHLGEAPTIFESLDDAGLVTAAVNIPCYRGRTSHRTVIPGVTRTTLGPKRFFFYSLFESDQTGAPAAWRSRSAGTVDAYAAAVGRWLVTRDGFDFFAYYLSDYDYLSHAHGPDSPREGIARVDRALWALIEAAGGPDDFFDRYAVLLCSDHGQTHVSRSATLQKRFRGVEGALVTASNRAGMVYRLDGCRLEVPELAARLDREPSVDLVAYRDGEDVVVRRDGVEVTNGVLDDYPEARTRLAAALRNPNAGDVLVSAAAGYEFADLGGRHHAGGGSHGSLVAGDSEVPVLLAGLEGEPRSIVDFAPLVRSHFGV